MRSEQIKNQLEIVQGDLTSLEHYPSIEISKNDLQ